MLENSQKFLGAWKLDPTQSKYEFGQPPQAGSYLIEPEGNGLRVTMEWTNHEGQAFKMDYFGIPDGKDYPYEGSPAVDTLTMTQLDTSTLDSTSKKAGQVVAFGRRVLAPDGKSMFITQSGTTSEGTAYSNYSVYLKQD